MKLRQSPFANTFRNLAFNLRNFKPSSKRPSFKASIHPFSTNAQLLDASYSRWLLQTSKDMRKQVFDITNEFVKVGKFPLPIGQNMAKALMPATIGSLHAAREVSWKFPKSKVAVKAPISNDLESICKKLSDERLTADVMNELVDEVMRGAPTKSLTEEMVPIEMPTYQTTEELSREPFTKFLESKIPILYDWFKSYANVMRHNQKFQENYIWLCYHMNDLDSLQDFTFAYLNKPRCGSDTFSYIMSAFILNYEVEFSKNLFTNLLSMGKPVQKLLEVTIFQLLKVDALFENVYLMFQTWITHPNCSEPSPEALALLSKEFAMYANELEQGLLDQIIGDNKNHPWVRFAQVQNSIICREPNNFKKSITTEDLDAITSISLDLEGRLLQHFYLSLLTFMSKYSNMNMIRYVFMMMKKDNVEISEEYLSVVAQFYANGGKFIQLFQFLTESNIQFNPCWVKYLYHSLVVGYPYLALETKEAFTTWLKNSGLKNQQNILKSFRLRKLCSHLTPYHLHENKIESKKYECSQWSMIEWKKEKDGSISKVADQVGFRNNSGFREILRKGVKPDLKVLLNTFKRLNENTRDTLQHIFDITRLRRRTNGKLILHELKLKNDHSKAKRFFDSRAWLDVNSNQKIEFARMTMNSKLYQETNTVLGSLRSDEMNDRSEMMKLNIALRNCLSANQYDEMVKQIDSFDKDGTIMSPFLSQQCRHIEKHMMNKLNGEREVPGLNRAIEHIRGFIGDIEVRLNQDKTDIRRTINQALKYFNKLLDQDPRQW